MSADRSSTRIRPVLLRAARAAWAVDRATEGCAPRAVARAFAYESAGCTDRGRPLALALAASMGPGGKGWVNIDLNEVRTTWAALDTLRGPTPLPRPHRATRSRGRGRRLPVERARAVPIVAVMERSGIALRRVGREWRGRCPFHDDRRPSLRVDPTKGVWYCDPCGVGGDAIAFVTKFASTDFAGAVRELASW